MLLGIDASSANKAQKTGVEWYAYNLIQAMKKIPVAEDDRVFLYSPEPLTGGLAELPPRWESRLLRWPFKRGWMQGRMSLEMMRRPSNILFVPSQGLPRVIPKRRDRHQATATTIHDIAFLRRPDLYEPRLRRELASRVGHAARRAHLIFTPTEFTKTDIADAYRLDLSKIVVTPLAADVDAYRPLPFEEYNPILQSHRLSPKQYFLFIGRLELKKNIGTIVRAFELFKQRRGFGDPYELVLVGAPGFGFETVRKYVDGSPNRAQIRELGYAAPDAAVALLNGAAAFLFPGWYEGFGIPNLEALACGAPLIASDIPAHREIVGSAGRLIPPGEPESWAAAMTDVASGSSGAERRCAAGIERAKSFSWSRTAELTWNALWNLVKG